MLFKGDNYFNPENDLVPGDYGKNYPEDLKQYAKLVAEERKKEETVYPKKTKFGR